MKTLIMSLCLLLLSCASSQKAAVQKQNVEGKTKQENNLYHPRRSKKVVFDAIDKMVQDITRALSEAAPLYTKSDTVTLQFYITPGGALDLIGFAETISLDTLVMKNLSEAVNRQILKPIDKRTFTKVSIKTFLDANKQPALSDKRDIDHVEIRQLSNILIIVNMNSGNIVRAYSKRWAEKPALEGRITTKFGIDDMGNVVSCAIVSSTVNDSPLEEKVIKEVKSWKFGAIYNPGDVTEVVYPFNFSQ